MTDISSNKSRNILLLVAWIAMLVVSTLPVIILQEIFHISVPYISRMVISLIFLLLMLALTFVWPSVRVLREYFIVFIILAAAEWFVYNVLGNLPAIQSYLDAKAFVPGMFATQTLRMIVTLIMFAGLMLIKRRREAFYLVKGDLGATADPIPLIMTKPEPWTRLGRALSVFISLGTLAFLLLAAGPSLIAQYNNGSLDELVKSMILLIPAVLLFAAMNAFSEELTYKASFLSVLYDPVGKQQALLLMAAYFGIGHYYGIPYGIVGVIMAGILGWLLGKSMVETKGFMWAWFVHFLQDILIFTFLAIGSVTPGGS